MIRENTKMSANGILGYYELKKHTQAVVQLRILRIMRSKETSYTAVVTGSK
jgi:hypothetical protein